MHFSRKVQLKPVERFSGKVAVPGDKSISHRALIFGSIAEGNTTIYNLLQSADLQSTANCLQSLGIKIENKKGCSTVSGQGLEGLSAPVKSLDCGNSGTTMRLLAGLLCGQRFDSVLTGDASLQRRPMKRVSDPLTLMGAHICLTEGKFAPFTCYASRLLGREYLLPVASAQVKTALLLAGLYAEGQTVLKGATQSRDHTERMLPLFGVSLGKENKTLSLVGRQTLQGTEIHVPGDPSSAAFWIAAACLVPGGEVEIPNVLLNPTRMGFIRVLIKMGAQIDIRIDQSYPEEVGTVFVKQRELRGIEVPLSEIPALIDELPVLAVVAANALGVTVVHGAQELRVKECDRIQAVESNLKAMGVQMVTYEDGFMIEGKQKLNGARLSSFHDHRIAMAFSIASLVASGEVEIEDADCVEISYPGFFEALGNLSGNVL